MYRYKLYSTKHSSAKYGACEICGKHVSEVYYQTEEKQYVSVLGQEGWTQFKCHNLFGHQACLLSQQKPVIINTREGLEMIKTHKEIKAEWRKMLREEKKRLEAQLHPCPKINDCDILHQHLRGGKIRFTAWKGTTPLNNGAQLLISRHDILRHNIPNEFYMLYKKDMEWLATTT